MAAKAEGNLSQHHSSVTQPDGETWNEAPHLFRLGQGSHKVEYAFDFLASPGADGVSWHGRPLAPVPVASKIDGDDIDLPYLVRGSYRRHLAIVSLAVAASHSTLFRHPRVTERAGCP
jgi:hypothetical protein